MEDIDVAEACRFVKLLLSYRESIAPNCLITLVCNEAGLSVLKVQREDYYRTGKLDDLEVVADASLKLTPPGIG